MKRYLVVFITDGQFTVEAVMADHLQHALERFVTGPLLYDEIYSITLAL